MIEFRVLGPLEVVRQGRVLEIAAGKQRALLAVLLLHANEVVSSDRLIDQLWGGRAPATAPKILQGYVSKLRKTLGDESSRPDPDGGGGMIVTRPPGYVLQLGAEQLDARLFAALLARARAAQAADAAHEASALLRDALALWRGPALADFVFDSFAQEEIARLEELRLEALEERIDAELALGRHGDLVAELEALVARQPLRERPRGQLMAALYRCGRQAEALQVYQDARRVLVAELGLEPGRALQQLEQAILRQDPSLEPPPPPEEPSPRVGDSESESRPDRRPRSGDVFVGRERELAALLGALDDALSGRGRLLLIGGEPGIGKSRLAEELARRARDRRVEVLWGRCWEAGGAPPYWPWIEAIRSCVHDRSTDQLRVELGPGAVEIAGLVPDVHQRLPDLGGASELADPEQARFRLFDAITGFLRNASRTRPLVLVLDDLNWADTGSLLLLEFVARGLGDARVLLIGIYRDIELVRGHPLSRTLGELARERRFERLLLHGLSHEDVERFIEASCAFSPDEALVRSVHAQCEGNPFFVGEVVRLLTDEGALTPEGFGTAERWSARIPEGVRETIGRRLDRLSEACNETLTIASVIGREFALDQLARLIADPSGDQLLEALEEALTAHLIEELPGAAGRYQFTHALIQGTLADELSLARRARLHARIAEALEQLYGDRADAHAVELAHHFFQAEAVVGSAKHVRYSLLAGEAALAAHAPEEAFAHFQRGLAAKASQAMDDETAALFFGLGRAQIAMLARYELEPAVDSLGRAFDYYADRGDVGHAVAVAACPIPLSVGLAQAGLETLITRGLELVPPDSYEAGRLLAQQGWFSGVIEAGYEEAARAFRRALTIARRHGDRGLERSALANAAFVDAFHLRWQDCLSHGQQAIELAERAGEAYGDLAGRRVTGWALKATGDRERARLHAAAVLASAESLRERWWLASAAWDSGLLALYEGEWERSRELTELGLAAQPRDPRHLSLRAALEHELGDVDVGAGYVAQLEEVAESVPPPGPIADHVLLAGVIPLVGRTADSAAGFDTAAAAAERVLALPRLAPVLVLLAKSALALIAVQRADAEAAELLYPAIASEAGTASFFVPLTSDRLLGLLAATSGRLESAAAHFESGLAFCARAGYRPEYAWTASDYADALLRRAGTDRARAVALQDEALGIARELGMRPLRERVLSRRRILNA